MSTAKASPEKKVRRHTRFETTGVSYNVDKDGPLIQKAYEKAELNRMSFAAYILRLIGEDLARTGEGRIELTNAPQRSASGEETKPQTIKIIK